jgi:hypothetical protein
LDDGVITITRSDHEAGVPTVIQRINPNVSSATNTTTDQRQKIRDNSCSPNGKPGNCDHQCGDATVVNEIVQIRAFSKQHNENPVISILTSQCQQSVFVPSVPDQQQGCRLVLIECGFDSVIGSPYIYRVRCRLGHSHAAIALPQTGALSELCRTEATARYICTTTATTRHSYRCGCACATVFGEAGSDSTKTPT